MARLVLSVAAVLLPAWVQAGNCVGNSLTNNYYPTINNSFPDANTFNKGRFKIDNQIFPDTSLFGCISPPPVTMNPNATHWHSEIIAGQSELKYPKNFTNMSPLIESVQYWCNPNGTVLSWREFNSTSCADKDVASQGNASVPFTVQGYTFDCVCLKSNIFVERLVFNETVADVPGKVEKRYPGVGKCGGPSVSTLAMSGTCLGYFDNVTQDRFSPTWVNKNVTRGSRHRSVMMRCSPRGDMVDYMEFQGTLDCDPKNIIYNASFESETCMSVRNETMTFKCEKVGGGGLGKTKYKPKQLKVSPDDITFLAICFAYLCFVCVVVSVLGCYLNGYFEKRAGEDGEAIPEAEPVAFGDLKREDEKAAYSEQTLSPMPGSAEGGHTQEGASPAAEAPAAEAPAAEAPAAEAPA
eukprot:CAMPEP_0172614948 /NCGR_PEP_ID=MMETSP1068-20121228/55727_1 /TAXON_ID=35684 /ORGANISM="Pseudopedinella elastica, Strain CCMP716" /LENGTH=409 /DNA_ID=CAMNT_0013419917 /DNA_START=80 /DNA_END=1306 /DNA_ORIENTATION=-